MEEAAGSGARSKNRSATLVHRGGLSLTCSMIVMRVGWSKSNFSSDMLPFRQPNATSDANKISAEP
jgi:hypothetical protein